MPQAISFDEINNQVTGRTDSSPSLPAASRQPRACASADSAFTAFGLTGQDVARLRERFVAWPRDAEATDSQTGTDTRTWLPAIGQIEDGQPRGFRDTLQAEPEEPEIEP